MRMHIIYLCFHLRRVPTVATIAFAMSALLLSVEPGSSADAFGLGFSGSAIAVLGLLSASLEIPEHLERARIWKAFALFREGARRRAILRAMYMNHP